MSDDGCGKSDESRATARKSYWSFLPSPAWRNISTLSSCQPHLHAGKPPVSVLPAQARAQPGRGLVGRAMPAHRRLVHSPEIAPKEYESLVDQLNNPSTGSEIAGSVLAKAYGGMISGAAYFDNVLRALGNLSISQRAASHNSVFFNNYGVRTMPDSLEPYELELVRSFLSWL